MAPCCEDVEAPPAWARPEPGVQEATPAWPRPTEPGVQEATPAWARPEPGIPPQWLQHLSLSVQGAARAHLQAMVSQLQAMRQGKALVEHAPRQTQQKKTQTNLSMMRDLSSPQTH